MFKDSQRERWHLNRLSKKDVANLSLKLDIDPVLAKILLARNVGEGDEVVTDLFLNPPEHLITDVNGVSTEEQLSLATSRVKQAIENGESIVINGDPDADGISGTTILVAGLRNLGARVSFDFPTRATEGHGLQPRIIDEAKKAGAKLIITSDCGSKDLTATEYAKQKDIDVIICDHHILGKRLPDAYAMINPHMVEGPTYFKTLSGAAVSFKFVLAIFNLLERDMPLDFRNYLLAVASLGTISDRMSFLDPMNRIMVIKGVESINTTHMEGLKALKEISAPGIRELMPRDISRTIVPRLNAPGRIGDKSQGILDSNVAAKLLLIGSGKKNAKKASAIIEKFEKMFDKEAEKKQQMQIRRDALNEAEMVDDVNEKRKYMTSKIEDEIDILIKTQVNFEEDRIIVIKGKEWNPGVIGIDTDRLKERFLRPALILTEYEGSEYLRGSVRSIPSINIYRIIDQVGDLFLEKHDQQLFKMKVETESGVKIINAFGGHAQACGFSIHKDDVEEFITLLRAEMAKIPDNQFDYHYEIIDTLEFSELTPKLVKKLDRLSPYGQKFDFPIFYVENCTISNVRSFGNRYQQARTPHIDGLIADHPDNNNAVKGMKIGMVGFGLSEKYHKMKRESKDQKYDVIFMIELHRRPRRGGKFSPETLRLNVLDIRHADEDNFDLIK